MKIMVLNYENASVELVTVDNSINMEDIEIFLDEKGFNVSNINWMECGKLSENFPMKYHRITKDGESGEEIHSVRESVLDDGSVYDSVQEIKRRERKELIQAVRQYGKQVEDGVEYRFDGECPIVAAYDYEEPADVVILTVKVDKDDNLIIMGDEKNDRGNVQSIEADDIFAGQVDFITQSIG